MVNTLDIDPLLDNLALGIASAAAVPEPVSATLLLIAGGFATRRRRVA